jgi:thiamine biosynthesis protein ThiI
MANRAETVTAAQAVSVDEQRQTPLLVLVKVGEASLKGRNRRFFLEALRRNLWAALGGLGVRLEGGGSVLRIPVADDRLADEVASRIERVFGIVAASLCKACERSPDAIAAVALELIESRRPATFAVRVRRRDKGFPFTSQQLEREIGTAIQNRTQLPVNLSSPDFELRVEIDHRDAYVHVKELSGAGGLPVGTSGRALCLLSGGIDSPIAALMALKRGLAVHFVHFSGEPYLEPVATTKAQAQARVLNGFQAADPGTLWVVPFGDQQRMLSAVSAPPNRIVLYRRQMARVACALAVRLGAAALVTGDSLGQVSSQTLPNMTSVDDASSLPVLRPLLAWDKREVMGRAAALGILALSELPADDACPLFTEGKQRTAVPRAELVGAESRLDLAAMTEDGAERARAVEPGVFLERLERESRAA